MADISMDLLRAKAEARVEESEAAQAGRTLKLEFSLLESNLLAQISGQAIMDMLEDFAQAETDDERVNVLVARTVMRNIAGKFKAAHEAERSAGKVIEDAENEDVRH